MDELANKLAKSLSTLVASANGGITVMFATGTFEDPYPVVTVQASVVPRIGDHFSLKVNTGVKVAVVDVVWALGDNEDLKDLADGEDDRPNPVSSGGLRAIVFIEQRPSNKGADE